jgi:heme-degrading monooxygenase HmoA
MTKSVLSLRTQPGSRDALVEAFRRLGVFDSAAQIPGFRGGALHIAHDDDQDVLVTARWDSREAYAAWLASPVREQLNAALLPLLEAPPTARTFSVVDL